MNAPAFSAVPARRAFHEPPPPQQPAKTKIDWPLPVRDYVQRSFAPDANIPGIDKVEIETKLKMVISTAATNNTLDILDWVKMPLPQQMLLEERAQRAQAAPLAVQLPLSSRSKEEYRRKRNSADADLSETDNARMPPWRTANGGFGSRMEDRITYTHPNKNDRSAKRQKKKADDLAKASSKYQHQLEKRRNRFRDQLGSPSPQPWHSSSPTPDADAGPVVGTCQNMEKHYYRLTAPPKPESVRPQPVLERTLEMLKTKWSQRVGDNYAYICDQFKSMRQDLTVQHIKNEFTVSVYEIHARIALEKGDLGEYNQCQTQLRGLYAENLGGHPSEFLAYRILYLIHTCNRADMNDILAEVATTDKSHHAIKHALAVRSALALGNYHRFFRLYLQTPNMGMHLMDHFIVRERLAALANITKAYKMDVEVRFLTEELGFSSDYDAVQFLCDYGAQALIHPKEDGVSAFATAKAGPHFEQARLAAFRKVDIKGQI